VLSLSALLGACLLSLGFAGGSLPQSLSRVVLGAAGVCRAAAGPCDLPEVFDGLGNCPADLKRPPTVLCRPAAGPCDVPESCDGSSNACPGDIVLPAGTVCRASGFSAICDPADLCDGTRKLCVGRLGQPGTSCGPGKTCDLAGHCS
jgi:hypothetical protein